ncbi:MAG: cryptochrome/photolyase family protein [Bacteroidota bacterium]
MHSNPRNPDLTLRLILGDQLSHAHSWFKEVRDDVVYLMAESRSETDYAKHHIQKVLGFFHAMRSFADELTQAGHRIIYVTLDDPHNQGSITAECLHHIKQLKITRFEYQEPDEWRVQEHLRVMCEQLSIPTSCVSSEHFLSDDDLWNTVFKGKKTRIMENFYRFMRKHHHILMNDAEPEGGAWNFDKENRKSIPKTVPIPEPFCFDHDVSPIASMLDRMNVQTIGKVDAQHFPWPKNREESLQLIAYFNEHLLPFFGMYQDAMTDRSWSLFHSRLSFSINVKMLHPLEVINSAIETWKNDTEKISISQIEGYVRQILGWREYMRGIYREYMPDYAKLNTFNHDRELPEWFWTGKTDMHCLSMAINQSLDHAYAHHIQRLMVTGNYALLAGIHPDHVDAWYLGIYMDAIEWVEMPNTRGMSQFADGGIVGTKPYISSAAYINSMSDYCKNCTFDPKKKIGDDACPFNSLYWHFYHRHRPLLGGNNRIGMMYAVWDKMDNKEAILHQAEKHLNTL